MHNITTKFKLAAKQAAANVLADNKKKSFTVQTIQLQIDTCTLINNVTYVR